MKMKNCITLCLFFLCGCSATTLTVPEFNPKTGLYEEIKYSKFFQDEAFLIGKEVKVYAIVTLEKKRIPGMYNLQKKMGSLGPDEIWTQAELNIYFHNITEHNIPMRLNSILFNKKVYPYEMKNIVLVPKTVEKIIIPELTVESTDMKFDLHITYQTSTGNKSKSLTLKRLTILESKERRFK